VPSIFHLPIPSDHHSFGRQVSLVIPSVSEVEITQHKQDRHTNTNAPDAGHHTNTPFLPTTADAKRIVVTQTALRARSSQSPISIYLILGHRTVITDTLILPVLLQCKGCIQSTARVITLLFAPRCRKADARPLRHLRFLPPHVHSSPVQESKRTGTGTSPGHEEKQATIVGQRSGDASLPRSQFRLCRLLPKLPIVREIAHTNKKASPTGLFLNLIV